MNKEEQDFLIAVGQRIKRYRNARGFSQEELSERSGLHRTYISQLEKGERNATLLSLRSICKGLELPLSTILSELDIL